MASILEIALNEYGVAEIPGEKHNPEVMKYFDATSFGGQEWVADEVPWCSAFLNWVVDKAGYVGTDDLKARSWLDWGVKTTYPHPGDVVIYWREAIDSWKGHAGIIVRVEKDGIWTLGANQDNSVCIKKYGKDRVLGYRRPPMQEFNFEDLNVSNMKGWKTILFMVLTAALAGVDAISDMLTIPDWYYMYAVPFVGFVLRFLTTTPVLKSDPS